MIRKLTIANFKAFEQEQTLSPACDRNRNVSKLTLLVGPNNTGKSTVLAAVEDLLTGRQTFTAAKEQRHGDDLPTVTVNFENQIISLKSGSGSKYMIEGSTQPIQQSLRYIPSRRPWTDIFSGYQDESDYKIQARNNRKNNRNWVDTAFGAALMTLSLDEAEKNDLGNYYVKWIRLFVTGEQKRLAGRILLNIEQK